MFFIIFIQTISKVELVKHIMRSSGEFFFSFMVRDSGVELSLARLNPLQTAHDIIDNKHRHSGVVLVG